MSFINVTILFNVVYDLYRVSAPSLTMQINWGKRHLDHDFNNVERWFTKLDKNI
jgi:hypothetical protein